MKQLFLLCCFLPVIFLQAFLTPAFSAENASGRASHQEPLIAAGNHGAMKTAMTQTATTKKAEAFLDALLNFPILNYAYVSPDGKSVAWKWIHKGPAGDAYVAPTDGSAPPKRLTHARDDVFVCDWSEDSKSILVAQDTDGDERYRLFLIDISAPPDQMHLLTDEHPSYFLQGGQLHPNKRWLLYGANYDFGKKKEIEPTWIYRQDIESGERKVLAKPVKAGSSAPDLNKQGTHVIYARNDIDPSGTQIWLVDIEGKNDREILNFGAKKKVGANWCDDGKHIVFTAEADRYRKVGTYNIEDGKIKWLIDDPKRNIESAIGCDRSKLIIVEEIKNARTICSFLDPETGNEKPVLHETKQVGGTLIPLEPVSEGQWVGITYGSTQPGDIGRVNIGGAGTKSPEIEAKSGALESKSLTRLWENGPVKREELFRAEEFRWTSSDGLGIHGFLYRAKNAKGTIVDVHGGPTGHNDDSFDTQTQFFVSQGFNVFNPNYRGSTGYGLQFQDSIKKEGWGGKEQEDIRTGIEALIKAGIAAPGKVGITGTSYGGYSSWYAITHFPPNIVAASAPICGMTDLVVDYNTTRPDLRPYSEEMMGGSPKQVPERYKERSPINFVQNIKGKLLIVQGGQDPNVTPENVKQVEAALRTAGIKYEVLLFPDEGHGISKPANERTLYLKLLDFFERAMKE